MRQFLITVCISNHNTSDFTLNSINCLKKITKNPYKIIIRDNYSRLKDYLKLKKKVQSLTNIELYRIEDLNIPNAQASLAHAIALNDLISRIDTKYGAVIDSDFTFLYKNWDEILIDELNENYPIIGTQAPIAETSEKLKDFPYVFGFFFDTKIMHSLNIDFRPDYDDIRQKDTGYKLRDKYLENGYEGKLLLFKNTRDYKQGPFRNVICAEYYLEGHNEIFGSHFGRGSSLGAQKYRSIKKLNLYSIPIIRKYLLEHKGKFERKKWIDICKNIVNNQDSK